MKEVKDLKIGDRVLYRTQQDPHLIWEGKVRRFSPSGKYVNLDYGRWHPVSDVQVVDEFPDLEDVPRDAVVDRAPIESVVETHPRLAGTSSPTSVADSRAPETKAGIPETTAANPEPIATVGETIGANSGLPAENS